MNLNYTFVGNPEADRLILFLHEGLGSIKQWKNFPEKVCKATNSYGLIYDRSGYGESSGSLLDRGIDYLHLSAVELNELIISIVPKKYKLFLYGHSDGGSIALIFAGRYTHSLAGIITEAAHVFVEPETIEGVKKALPNYHMGKFDGLAKYHGERYKEVFIAWNKIWLNPDFRNWNITEYLPIITCPILIIQGKEDQYGTLKQVNAIQVGVNGPSSVFIPENCGHAPHKEKEKMTLLKVSEFINVN